MTAFRVTCSFNHITISFGGGECPVCRAEDALEDAQKEIKSLKADVKRLTDDLRVLRENQQGPRHYTERELEDLARSDR